MSAISLLEQAASDGKLSPGAVDNIRVWLTEPRYSAYVSQIEEHLESGKWQALDDAFWTIIPFGTGGRRGRMYPIGSNAINDRTIGESAQGLANYLESAPFKGDKACAIAYDTRHRSREFAELCAGIMVANGFKVYFLDGYRSTPELSFLVRYKNCCCGIMVTASHNPPSDNAVKIYGSHGGQLVPPDDKGVIEQVMQVDEIKSIEFGVALASGQVEMCLDEVDSAFLAEHKKQVFPGPRDLKVIYSPLHGVGEFNVSAALEADGFNDVEIYQPHREPSGDFPNVPGHVSNPENPEVFSDMIARAKETGAELILATDPDCDRMGAAAPLTLDRGSEWKTFTGNQLGSLLADFVLSQHQKQGTIKPESYIVKTLVTTDLIKRVGDGYGVQTFGDLHVGFKWIGELMEREGASNFLFGTEESHGFLVGEYCRDKDGAVACMLMCELAAVAKADGMSLHQKLDSLYEQHGYHEERLINVKMEGSDGMRRMQELMKFFRETPPKSLGGIDVADVRDYGELTVKHADGEMQPLSGPQGNMLILDLKQVGNMVAVRPSGTEPKIKFYVGGYQPLDAGLDLSTAKSKVAAQLDQIEEELKGFA